jgi:hypothetical protein
MRRTFELAFNQLFRSRWGIAVVIAVLVLAVVGIGRVFTGGTDRNPVLTNPTAAPTISVDPKDDDSIIISEPPPTPVKTSSGTAAPEAVAYAFASAWVDHKGMTAKKWYDGLLPHATKSLADKLSGVDPEGVPADRIVGRPALVPVGDGLIDAVVTVDNGQVKLRLVAPDGRWLVDGVDWEQS